MRDNNTMTKSGAPDMTKTQFVGGDPKTAVAVEEDRRNEVFASNLVKEESCVSVCTEPLSLVSRKLYDLTLFQAQAIKVRTSASENLIKVSIPDQFINLDVRRTTWLAFDITSITKEVIVDITSEDIFRFCDSTLPVCRAEQKS